MKVVFDTVQELFVYTHNTMRCQMSEELNLRL